MEDHRRADRRMSIIASHFAAAEEEIASPHRIFLANCSSSLNSVIRRCDNRALFARQGSVSQPPFMRQVSLEQNSWHGNLHQENLPGMSSGCENEKYSYALPGAPLFSRPAQADSNILNVGDCQPENQVCEFSAIEPPAFARPSKGTPGQKQHSIKKIRHTAYCNGIGWSPRMDIAESGCSYMLTVDLPGVNMDEIRVEVEDQNLIVTGKRAIQWLRVEKVPVNSNPRYPQREILQGPYRVVWPLPTGVNKDVVSAEFIDGFLQITVRKL